MALDTPLSGAVDGRRALEAMLDAEGCWWRDRGARATGLAESEDARGAAAEVVVGLQHNGQSFELPLALVADKVPGGYGHVRVYHSTWPLNGEHKYRASIAWPAGELEERAVVKRYFHDMARQPTRRTC